jgi:hypothetical protein
LAILDPGKQGEESTVLLDPLFQVSGEKTEQIPEQNQIGQKVEQHTDQSTYAPNEGKNDADDAEDNDCGEQKHIKLIYAAASVHEAAERFGETLKHSFSTTLRKTIAAGNESRLLPL